MFAAVAVVVPTLTPVATTDDWAYTRLVQIFVAEGRLVVFPVVAASAVFQTVWGALFALLFGPSFGATRLSTVVMVGLSGMALYGLCRRLGIDRARAALGTAAYLFNPLVFVLAYTFMTDPHFTALLVIATYFYSRGLGDAAGEGGAGWAVVAGSAVAALAFLTRQQGALIAPAVVLYLLISHRSRSLRPNWAAGRLVLQVAALPLLTMFGYFLWLRLVNDVPDVQARFLREAVLEEGWAGTWWLLRRLTVVELVYLGFFALPIAVAALPALRRLVAELSQRGRLLFLVWEAVLIGGVASLWVAGSRMPYVAQFLGSGGLGPPDVLGSRPRLVDAAFRDVATVVCVAASLTLGLIAARGVGAARGSIEARVRPWRRGVDGQDQIDHGFLWRCRPLRRGHEFPRSTYEVPPGLSTTATAREDSRADRPGVSFPRSTYELHPGLKTDQQQPADVIRRGLMTSPVRASAGLVLTIALFQVAGIVPPSYHYIGWAAGSLDRYLLPLVPFAIGLALWACAGCGSRCQRVGWSSPCSHSSPSLGHATTSSTYGRSGRQRTMRSPPECRWSGWTRARPGTATTFTSTHWPIGSSRGRRRADPGGSTSTRRRPIRPTSSAPDRVPAT